MKKMIIALALVFSATFFIGSLNPVNAWGRNSRKLFFYMGSNGTRKSSPVGVLCVGSKSYCLNNYRYMTFQLNGRGYWFGLRFHATGRPGQYAASGFIPAGVHWGRIVLSSADFSAQKIVEHHPRGWFVRVLGRNVFFGSFFRSARAF